MSEERTGVPWEKVAAVAVGAAAVGGIGYLAYSRLHAAPADSALTAHAARSPAAVKEEGNELFKKGQYRQAIAKYTEAIEACSPGSTAERATYFQNRAAAQEKLSADAEVVADCSEAIAVNSKYTKAYLRRARAHERLMDYPASLKDFTAACILENFSHYPTMENADRVLKALSQVQAKEIYAARNGETVPLSTTFVESYLLSFCEDPVLNSLPSAAQTNGESGMASLKGLLVRKEYGDVTGAATRLLEAGGLSGKEELEARMIRATFGLIQGNCAQATEDFSAAFALMDSLPQDDFTLKMRVNGLVKRGSFYMQQGLKDECLADFAAAEKADASNADIFHHRGQLLILMGDGAGAKSDFARCAKLRPDFELARVQGCFADYRTEAGAGGSISAIDAAIGRFEAVVRDLPKCSEGFALLGQIYMERHAFAEAKEMFDKALELAPENANIHVHMGLLILQRSENLAEAKVELLKALEVDPNCEFAYETLGTLEVQRGAIESAVEFFTKALGLARTELEIAHLVSLREAALAQVQVARNLGVQIPIV